MCFDDYFILVFFYYEMSNFGSEYEQSLKIVLNWNMVTTIIELYSNYGKQNRTF